MCIGSHGHGHVMGLCSYIAPIELYGPIWYLKIPQILHGGTLRGFFTIYSMKNHGMLHQILYYSVVT